MDTPSASTSFGRSGGVRRSWPFGLLVSPESVCGPQTTTNGRLTHRVLVNLSLISGHN